MSHSDERIETQVVHAGEPVPRIGGSATVPIFQGAVFETREEKGYDHVRYPRLNNLPNHQVVHAKLAALEGGEDALVTSSGMAAITTTLMTILGGGGHILVQDCLYGGTYNFLTDDAADLGITWDVIDATDPGSWRSKIRPATRAVYTEALTNPLLQVADHRAITGFARENGLVSLVDSTFATPVNFRPLAIGYDIALHSCTKYLNGHSDLVAGAVIGSRENITRIRRRLNHLGGCLEPFGCFLLTRGLKTLVLRVRQQNASALALARWLSSRSGVKAVNYAGLETHPGHDRARELFSGFGGVLSFELDGGATAADRVISRLRLPIKGPSLGGVETLITRPTLTSHSGMSREDRERMGITDGLVRVSVGIESTEDLIADFEQALAA